jgi:hypothetical protein
MKKTTERLIEEAKLVKYSAWLETHGYMDSDWWAEQPDAVNRFLDEQSRIVPNIKGGKNESN